MDVSRNSPANRNLNLPVSSHVSFNLTPLREIKQDSAHQKKGNSTRLTIPIKSDCSHFPGLAIKTSNPFLKVLKNQISDSSEIDLLVFMIKKISRKLTDRSAN